MRSNHTSIKFQDVLVLLRLLFWKENRPSRFSDFSKHGNVPRVAKKFPELYELLALIDAVRVGRAREKKIAETKNPDGGMKIGRLLQA